MPRSANGSMSAGKDREKVKIIFQSCDNTVLNYILI